MCRYAMVAASLVAVVLGGCSSKLGGADAASDMSDTTDTRNAGDAADARACLGDAPIRCILSDCSLQPQYPQTCVDGAWLCRPPYKDVPPEPCCVTMQCLLSDGTVVAPVCSTGYVYCQTGTPIPLDAGVDRPVDASIDASDQ